MSGSASYVKKAANFIDEMLHFSNTNSPKYNKIALLALVESFKELSPSDSFNVNNSNNANGSKNGSILVHKRRPVTSKPSNRQSYAKLPVP